MKMRLFVAVTVFVLTANVITIWFYPTPSGNISFTSYQIIRVGMTRNQVEDILGGPPRIDYKSTPCQFSGPILMFPTCDQWSGPDGLIEINFDAWDCVVETRFYQHCGEVRSTGFWSWLP